jgi:hypothetical protein
MLNDGIDFFIRIFTIYSVISPFFAVTVLFSYPYSISSPHISPPTSSDYQ